MNIDWSALTPEMRWGLAEAALEQYYHRGWEHLIEEGTPATLPKDETPCVVFDAGAYQYAGIITERFPDSALVLTDMPGTGHLPCAAMRIGILKYLDQLPIPTMVYTNNFNGTRIIVTGFARRAGRLEDRTLIVLYREPHGNLTWAMPLEEFTGGIFKLLDTDIGHICRTCKKVTGSRDCGRCWEAGNDEQDAFEEWEPQE